MQRIENEVARKKDSMIIVHIWHPILDWLELYIFGKGTCYNTSLRHDVAGVNLVIRSQW